MNERIKQLLSQAIRDVDYIHFDKAIDEELAQMYIPDVFAERFAQMIVRECCAALHPMLRDQISRGQGGDLIKQHFGVAE